MPEASERTSAERVYEQIMGLEVNHRALRGHSSDYENGYVVGHRVARSAAAELARKAVGEVIEAKELAEYRERTANTCHASQKQFMQEQIDVRDAKIESLGRAFKSIYTILGWLNEPPLQIIERELCLMKERIVALSKEAAELASLRAERDGLAKDLAIEKSITRVHSEHSSKLRAENTALREAAEGAAEDLKSPVKQWDGRTEKERIRDFGRADEPYMIHVAREVIADLTAALAPAAGDRRGRR